MTYNWHKLRKVVHLLCFLIFVALPFFNVVRFDLPRQRFYFAGQELWINEFGIVFFALMFLMFLVVVSSVFYGRVYCGYLCPQMIFSEASMAIESRLRRLVVKKFIHWKPKRRELLVRTLFYGALAAASVGLAFIFMAYFVPPRDLARSLLSLDIRTAAGIAGASVTLLTFLDFSLLRLRFCTTVCPYGYLQGMLGDGHTLLVDYRDARHDCIECKKCVRICPMGIDIRQSPFQIECVHCGECIDACQEILARLGKPGLIHYAWGEKGELVGQASGMAWYQRIGIRDAKRVVVLLVLAFYASGLCVALAMRRTVLVRIAQEHETLYKVDAAGRIVNQFRYNVANRGSRPAAVAFSIGDLAGAALALQPNPVSVAPGAVLQGEFEISEPPARRSDMVSHFTIYATTTPERQTESFSMTFIAPVEEK